MRTLTSSCILGEALKSEYWVHVDYFPSHLGPDAGAEDDLIAILRHGCIGARINLLARFEDQL